MNQSRVHRITIVLKRLSSGEKIFTNNLAQEFQTTVRIIQLDFKEYIIPLFGDDTIYYNYSEKCYISKYPFLQSSLLNSEELTTIAILINKSKDKFSDKELSSNTEKLFEKLLDSLKNSIYKLPFIESIDENEKDILRIKNAIKNQLQIQCQYSDKQRELYPLKILNLDSYWYLINYDLEYDEVRRYHLNSIKDVVTQEVEFEFDEDVVKGFDNAINAYFEPHVKPFPIQLYLNKNVSKYFLRKPINDTQRVLKTYDDESLDIELLITDFMEIVPLIQSYIPNIKVISPDRLTEIIKENLEKYSYSTT